MKQNTDKKKAKFIAALRDQPIFEIACLRVGVVRSTPYRWLKADPKFKAAFEQAEEVSRGRITDLAESKIIEGIKDGDYRSSVYWLAHNTKRYRPYLIRPYASENDQLRSDLQRLQAEMEWLVNHIDIDTGLKIAGHDPEAFRAETRKILDEQRKRSNEL